MTHCPSPRTFVMRFARLELSYALFFGNQGRYRLHLFLQKGGKVSRGKIVEKIRQSRFNLTKFSFKRGFLKITIKDDRASLAGARIHKVLCKDDLNFLKFSLALTTLASLERLPFTVR